MLAAILVFDFDRMKPLAGVSVEDLEYRLEAVEIKLMLGELNIPFVVEPLTMHVDLVVKWNRIVEKTHRVSPDQPILLITEEQEPRDPLLIGGIRGVRRYFTEQDRSWLIARLQGKGYKGN